MRAETGSASRLEAGPLCRDVMLNAPDTVPATMTVEAARLLLDSPRLRMLLVADGDRMLGALTRERLETEADGSLPLPASGTLQIGIATHDIRIGAVDVRVP